MATHDEARLDHRMIGLIKQINLYLNHFPKHEKYGLSLQIRTAAYDVYGLIVECQKRYHRKTALTNLDIRHEQLRMFVRLASELGYFSFKDGTQDGIDPAGLALRRYHAVSKKIDEIGCLIGGWIRSEKERAS